MVVDALMGHLKQHSADCQTFFLSQLNDEEATPWERLLDSHEKMFMLSYATPQDETSTQCMLGTKML